ncbi:hypothetical protein OS493_007010 [Desmophyllum pertusum]|uniref:Uncharacterized protein n=1 Tax=Desmophyllum pertusum TaxID=174260 RepID=A0A9W9ZFT4_9CNID|nr:hypothetical protein OS493_007010 [Desmophyllum pertusum]
MRTTAVSVPVKQKLRSVEDPRSSKLTKLRATSNVVIQETKGTISSISRFLDLLKAIDAQDIVKATQLLVNSIDLVKERNRTIRIADSSDGGGLQLSITRIHELNAVALDLDDDKRFRAAEREAISDRNRTRARRGQNAERLQNRLTVSAWTVLAWAVHNFNSPQTTATTTTTRFPQSCKRGLSFFCGSFGHWWTECPVRLARTFPSIGNVAHAFGASTSTSTSPR